MSIADLLEKDEGRMRIVYDDATGFPITKGYTVQGNPTIGVGFLLSAPGGLTDDEIDWILANRVQKLQIRIWEALPWVKDMSQARQDVITSMAWQLGFNGLLSFKSMLHAAEQGKYDVAAVSMLNSVWYDQTPERAEKLASFMRAG